MTSEFFLNAVSAYRTLFWPEFVEHDGCVFLAFDEGIYRHWMQQTGEDRAKVEAMINHRHIVDLLPETLEKPTEELVVKIGQLLQELWDTKLRRDFPDRCFTVSFPLEPVADLNEFEITFFQSKK